MKQFSTVVEKSTKTFLKSQLHILYSAEYTGTLLQCTSYHLNLVYLVAGLAEAWVQRSQIITD